METTAQETEIASKTKELCQAILDQPGFAGLKQKIDAFMNDEMLKFQYQMISERGTLLQMKQSEGLALTETEISEFQTKRDELMQNPIAKGFIDAQAQVAKVQDSINKYLTKTYELGRIPTELDINDGCCGNSGCGCE